MIKVIGDVHLRSEEPFFSVTKNFLSHLLKICNEKDHLVFTGDFFHRSRPYSEELACARQFFETAKERNISINILAGNHEYFRERNTWAEDVFKDYDINFITEPKVSMFYGIQFAFLPWIPNNKMQKEFGVRDMRSYYAQKLPNLMSLINKDKNIYILYHFEDETVFMGNENIGVDLSVFEKELGKCAIRLGGHIHNPSKNYIGSPYTTRKDETGFERHIIEIDPKTDDFKFIKISPMIEYETLMYEELKNKTYDPNIKYIIKVLNAPSFESVKDYIDSKENVWLDDYELKFNEDRTILDNKENQLYSIKEFLDMYIKQNKVDSNTANYLLSLF